MSTLSTAQRNKLPLSDFGWPEKRLFPIVDQSDVMAAAHLIGRAKGGNPTRIKARIIAIARRKGLRIPEAWETGRDTDRDADD